MRYTELFESPSQVKSLSAITQAIVGYLYHSIDNYRKRSAEFSALIMHPDVELNDPRLDTLANTPFAPDHGTQSHLKNFRSYDFQEYPEEAKDEYYKQLVKALSAVFHGHYRSTEYEHDHPDLHFEIGTVGEILKWAHFNISSVPSEVYDALKDVLIILTDNKQEFGKSTYNDNPNRPGMVFVSFAKLIGSSRMGLKRIANIMIHELTHSLDSRLTKGKNGMTGDKDPEYSGYDAYLSSYTEVNARYSQLAATLDFMIKNNQALQDNKQQLHDQIKRLIKKNQLTPQEIGDDQYKRIMKRLFAHLNHKD